MNARRKFTIVDRVEMSPAYGSYARAKIRTGKVIGFGYKHETTVRVLLDGTTRKGKPIAPVSWHMDFWEKVGDVHEA
jgi:hypothetical protein